MPQVPGNFNASAHEDMNDFSTIPKDDYIASIVKSDIVLTKKAKEANDPSQGQMIKFQLKVQGGKYKGKILFAQLNIVNPNPTAVEIAQKELATIARACGINGRVENTEMLHGIPMKISVDIETSANYPDKNIITMYESADGASVGDGSVSIAKDTTADDGDTSSNDDGDNPAPEKKKKPWD